MPGDAHEVIKGLHGGLVVGVGAVEGIAGDSGESLGIELGKAAQGGGHYGKNRRRGGQGEVGDGDGQGALVGGDILCCGVIAAPPLGDAWTVLGELELDIEAIFPGIRAGGDGDPDVERHGLGDFEDTFLRPPPVAAVARGWGRFRQRDQIGALIGGCARLAG